MRAHKVLRAEKEEEMSCGNAPPSYGLRNDLTDNLTNSRLKIYRNVVKP